MDNDTEQGVCSRCMLTEQERDAEFRPCYASVLVSTADEPLQTLVSGLEQSILHSFTAWCVRCGKPCLITRNVHLFPCISAHHAHQVVQVQRLREFHLL